MSTSNDAWTAASVDSDLSSTCLHQAVSLWNEQVLPLRTKTQEKMEQINEAIWSCDFLMGLGVASKEEVDGLRQSKEQLKKRRQKVQRELTLLPVLEEEKNDLEEELKKVHERLGFGLGIAGMRQQEQM